MRIKKNSLYNLNAPWHTNHGEIVEIIAISKGITEAHNGKRVYFIATDPLGSRTEDHDVEFVSSNFSEVEVDDEFLMKIIINSYTTVATKYYEDGFSIDELYESVDADIRKEALELTINKLSLMGINVVDEEIEPS